MKSTISLILLLAVWSTRTFAIDLMVSSAASLTDVMQELKSEYIKDHKKVEIQFNFASSGTLRSQIETGAPVDIFFSASQAHMDILEKNNKIDTETRANIVNNKLCLVIPKNSKIKSIKDAKIIAIGNPAHVPVGKYAKQVFTSLNQWDVVKNKLIFGSNTRQVLDYVSRGEVDMGIVYTTDFQKRNDKLEIVHTYSSKNHSPISYPIAIISDSKNKNEALNFIQFLKTKRAKDIFVKNGFESR